MFKAISEHAFLLTSSDILMPADIFWLIAFLAVESLDQEPSLRLCLICNSWGFLSWLALGLSTAAVSPSLPRTTRACWISPQPLSSRVLCAKSLFAASLMEAPTRATTATGTLVFGCLCTSWTKYTCICTATTCCSVFAATFSLYE